jgi:hypothetical protein
MLDLKMPKNCIDCNNMGLRDLLKCDLIFSGCANCGRHPNCPIKAEIPKNATNGDVFEALFPWIKSEKDYENSMVAILVRGHKGYIHFDMEWWNAPWKGNDESRTD